VYQTRVSLFAIAKGKSPCGEVIKHFLSGVSGLVLLATRFLYRIFNQLLLIRYWRTTDTNNGADKNEATKKRAEALFRLVTLANPSGFTRIT
tara:strand:+ start:347 stop:622 length:276 start_codon:yes stop_codon:yes gene_type:complete